MNPTTDTLAEIGMQSMQAQKCWEYDDVFINTYKSAA